MEANHKRLLTTENKLSFWRGSGWGMDIKEDTCDEHWMFYGSACASLKNWRIILIFKSVNRLLFIMWMGLIESFEGLSRTKRLDSLSKRKSLVDCF